MPPRPHPFGRLDALERRYDGPIPPADPALLARPPAGLRARLFDRLAGDNRTTLAARRAGLIAAEVTQDPRLAQLSRTVGFYREQGVGWKETG